MKACRRILKLFILLHLACAMSCSFRKLAISQADWLAMRQINKYLDLNSEQELWLQPRVKSHIASVRKTMLPHIADDLGQMAERFGDGISAEEINWSSERFYFWRSQLLGSLTDDAVQLIAGLKPAQLEHLQRVLDEGNDEDKEDLALEREAYVSKRRKQTIKQIEYWVGDLSPEQESHVMGVSPQSQDQQRQWFDRRIGSQKKIMAFLRSSPGPEAIRKQVQAWGDHPGILWDMTDEEMERSRLSRLQRYELISRVLTKKQVEHLVAEINDLRSDLIGQ